MLQLTKFEWIKILKNRTLIGALVVTSFLLFGIFYVRYYQSQSNYAVREMVSEGYTTRIERLVEEKYSGDLTDEKVQLIVSDFMDLFQDNINIKNGWYDGPFYPFYWEIVHAFVPRKKVDIFITMIERVQAGERMSVEEVPIIPLADKQFTTFDKPLTIGNYGPWTDLYKASGDIYLLLALLGILVCSLVFADDTSRNMNQILFTTRYGRRQSLFSKLLAGIGVTSVIFLLVHIINFIVFMAMNDTSGWKSSIQANFAMKIYDFPMEWNHLQVYFWVIALQFFGVLFIVASSFLVSSWVKAPLSAFVAATGLYLLPAILMQALKTSSLAPFFHFFPVNQGNVKNMLVLLSGKEGLLNSTFTGNTFLLFVFLISGHLIFNLLSYGRMKSWSFK